MDREQTSLSEALRKLVEQTETASIVEIRAGLRRAVERARQIEQQADKLRRMVRVAIGDPAEG